MSITLNVDVPPGAFYDMFFLLTRGYPRSEALELVKRRYRLARPEAILLFRCVHSKHVSDSIRSKLVAAADLEGRDLVIDGFNQLTTIYAAVIGASVFVCSDGLTRDALLAGPRLVVENIDVLIPILAALLGMIRPRKTVVVLDSQPSRSGETASLLRRRLKDHSVVVEVSKTADKRIIEYASSGYVVASSDIAITISTSINAVFDLAGFAIKELVPGAKVNNIPRLLGELHMRWCGGAAGEGPVA
ncbi:DUF434 domain-containing protein [Pyrodictium abyssi]|uniref:DUF434 domain-containing protein n=1 Tax=Pyrodictium abyssi TaxID=54256 RepID=A0ABM8ISS4_9CREN|nr:hypothetical protein PABY_01810 [Pyrodictium abyssi]